MTKIVRHTAYRRLCQGKTKDIILYSACNCYTLNISGFDIINLVLLVYTRMNQLTDSIFPADRCSYKQVFCMYIFHVCPFLPLLGYYIPYHYTLSQSRVGWTDLKVPTENDSRVIFERSGEHKPGVLSTSEARLKEMVRRQYMDLFKQGLYCFYLIQSDL